MNAPKIKYVSALEQRLIERKLRKMPNNEHEKWLKENKYVVEKPKKNVDLPQDLGCV